MLKVWRAVLFIFCWAAAGAANALSVAIAPPYEPIRISRNWNPVPARIEQATGLKLQLRVYKTIDNSEAEPLKGVPDLVYLSLQDLNLDRYVVRTDS
jgi:hypothetical protein